MAGEVGATLNMALTNAAFREYASKNFSVPNMRYQNKDNNCFEFTLGRGKVTYIVVLIAAKNSYLEILPELGYSTRTRPRTTYKGPMFEDNAEGVQAVWYIIDSFDGYDITVCPKSSNESLSKMEGKILIYRMFN